NVYLQDGLGSVRSVVDDNAVVQSAMNYDPYGNPMGAYGAGFGFTGEQTDANGSVFLRARYYEPQMGVFNALDPFEGVADRAMSLNGYSWVEGNVPNAIDPTGQQTLQNMLNFWDGNGSTSGGRIPVPTQNNGNFARNAINLLTGLVGTEVALNPPLPQGSGINSRELQQLIQDGCLASSTIFLLLLSLTSSISTTRSRSNRRNCNPQAFQGWWNSLQSVGPLTVDPEKRFAVYEQTAARGIGTMGGIRPKRVPALAFNIDADGADPNTCYLIDAKYSGTNTMWSSSTPDFLLLQMRGELLRYRMAIHSWNGYIRGIPSGAEPRGLQIRTNRLDTIPFWYAELARAGFVPFMNGNVTFYPS
ncbi:MAG: RHS repeat-associated core domain-containing protein, partial [Bacteroidota bacterium]